MQKDVVKEFESVEERAYSKNIIADVAEAIASIQRWHDKLQRDFSDGILRG